MKILIVTPYLFPEGTGLGRFSKNLALALAKQGHRVTIACSGKRDETKKIDGLKVHFFRPWFFVSSTPICPTLFFELDKLIKKEKFDLVQAFTPVPYFADIAAFAAWKNKTPFLLVYNSFSLLKKGLILGPLSFLYVQSLERLLFRLSSRIIVYNKNLSDSTILQRKRENVSFVSPGLDTELFSSSDSQERHLLFVGSLSSSHKWKGLDYLLFAMKQVCKEKPDTKLVVAGTGDLLNHYIQTSKNLGLEKNVVFTGFLDKEKLVKAYQEAFFLVLPSSTDAELMGFVILEANSCGKPVIASRVGGIPFIVQEGVNGFLVEPKQPNLLSKKILTLLNDKKLRRRIGKNGRIFAKKFSWEKTANEFLEIYNQEVSLAAKT